ncbi:MAG: peptidase domain-containing protein [Methanomicrobiales archaeon HGW-Methanomicrobiales-5]|jgi:hypothetical protein|nr:MAG: peptidase domain-containing protein [Methanomicrobiales archaeon HGW-Methanomicrobiales-5]
MKVSGISLTILICIALLVSGVSALNVEKTGNYTVTPAGDLRFPSMTPFVTSTISQGQVVAYSRVVSPGTSSMITDLNWGNPANSLSLTIVAPDGVLGPFYDSADGTTNGRIALSISSPTGLTPGTWKFYIEGYHVTGTQTYSFVTY